MDLLFALKHAKWCVIPTLFVPLEDTRLAAKPGAKLVELTDLQWEFFFTCWRYNMDFFQRSSWMHFKFNFGIPFYYYLLARRLFGEEMKYPLFRLAHFPEWFLRGKLHLDFSGRQKPRYRVPEKVQIPEERLRPMIPELMTLRTAGS